MFYMIVYTIHIDCFKREIIINNLICHVPFHVRDSWINLINLILILNR